MKEESTPLRFGPLGRLPEGLGAGSQLISKPLNLLWCPLTCQLRLDPSGHHQALPAAPWPALLSFASHTGTLLSSLLRLCSCLLLTPNFRSDLAGWSRGILLQEPSDASLGEAPALRFPWPCAYSRFQLRKLTEHLVSAER